MTSPLVVRWMGAGTTFEAIKAQKLAADRRGLKSEILGAPTPVASNETRHEARDPPKPRFKSRRDLTAISFLINHGA